MRVNMRVKLLTITLLSQLAIASPSTQVFAGEAGAKAIPALTQNDRDFLKYKIGENKFKFPTDAKDKVINRVSSFLNDMRLTSEMTYQEVMDQLMKEDERSSQKSENKEAPLIPGAFLDAASALFAQIAANDKDDFKVFADILKIQARITGLKQIPVAQCIVNLRSQLDVAKKRGKQYKKVYVYSDGPEYEAEYVKLRADYQDIEIVYRIFPEDINVFFRDSERIDDGYVFIDRIPVYYEPMYASIWYPFYSRVYVDDSYFLGFGYPYNFGGWWGGYYSAFGIGWWGNWGYNRFGDRHWHDHHYSYSRDYGHGGKAATRSAKGGGKAATRSAKGGGKAVTRSAKGGGKAATRSAKGGGKAATRSAKGGGKSVTRSAKGGGGGKGGGGHGGGGKGGGKGGGGGHKR